MRMTRAITLLTASGSLCLLFSCTSRKKFIYFQGGEQVTREQTSFSPLLQKDDLLSIVVMGLDPDAVAPFNLPQTTYNQSTIGGYSQGAPTRPGYLFDSEGNIDFPV